MKKSFLLASGFAVAFLFSGCEKATVAPNPRAISTTQFAEEAADFYVTRDGEFHWGRQFVGSENGFAHALLSFDGKQLTVGPGEKTADSPTIHFSPALTEDATVLITNPGGETILAAKTPAGATEFSLGEVSLQQTGLYSLDVYLTDSPNLSRNVPRYIVKADGIVYDRHN